MDGTETAAAAVVEMGARVDPEGAAIEEETSEEVEPGVSGLLVARREAR